MQNHSKEGKLGINSLIYSSINNILRENLPKMKKRLWQIINDKNYNNIISEIHCEYEKSLYSNLIVNWRIDTKFYETLYDNDLKPHMIGCFWRVEISNKKKIIVYNLGKYYNSFVEDTIENNGLLIEFDNMNNDKVVNNVMNETIERLKLLEYCYIKNIDIFIKEYIKLKKRLKK
jgi:hypothetical protein